MTDLLKDTIEKLMNAGEGATRLRARNVKCPGLEPGKVPVLIESVSDTGVSYDLKLFDYPYLHVVNTDLRRPADLANYIRDRGAVLFVDADRLKLLAFLDPGDGPLEKNMGKLHTASVQLTLTPQWAAYVKGITGTPGEVIRLQRRMFAHEQLKLGDACPIDKFASQYLWKVKAQTHREVRTAQVNGGDTMGADATRQVLSEGGDWPGYVSVTLNVFEHVASPVTLPMLLEFDAEKNKVILEPIAYHQEEAYNAALKTVLDAIGEAAKAIHFGMPSFGLPGVNGMAPGVINNQEDE
jgi:hypothetical protein